MARELQQRAKVQRQLTDSAPCDAFCIGSVDSKAESPALQMMRAASDMEARVVDANNTSGSWVAAAHSHLKSYRISLVERHSRPCRHCDRCKIRDFSRKTEPFKGL